MIFPLGGKLFNAASFSLLPSSLLIATPPPKKKKKIEKRYFCHFRSSFKRVLIFSKNEKALDEKNVELRRKKSQICESLSAV